MKQKLLILALIMLTAMLNIKAQMVLEYNTNLSAGTTIALPLQGTVNVTVDWGDGTATQDFTSSGNQDHIYATDGTYTVTITGSLTQFGPNNYTIANKLTVVTSFGDLGITSFISAFNSAINLTQVPATLPVTVTDMSFMFYAANSFNGNISSWNVSNVTNMGVMFGSANSFNQDLSSWDVSSVTDMSSLFSSASSFNQDIGSWNVSNVIEMDGMFHGATSFNQDISAWNVGNVNDMEYMFSGATSFNQDISTWNVSSVTSMSEMFPNATSFNQDISSWNVSNVTSMSAMFSEATSFNQNISTWDISNVTDMEDMFYDVTLSTENYDAILNAWSQLTLQTGVDFHAGNSQYSTCNQAARDILTNAPNNWIITDDGSVADIIDPTVTCVADQTIEIAQGETFYTVNGTEFDPTAYDNCTVASINNDFNNTATLANAELPIGVTTITWTVTDEAENTATCSNDVTVTVASGLNDVTQEYGIIIYPNPATNQLTIDNGQLTIKNIAILDITGKAIKQWTINNSQFTIDMSDLNNGIYFIKVNNQVFKFVKE